MNRRLLASLAMIALPLAPAALAAPVGIAAALADTSRPEADTKADANRKPTEMLTFAQVKPGQTIVDFMPGRGYFTRLFSSAVGAKGSVYAVVPQILIDRYKAGGKTPPPSVSTEPGHGNVKDAISGGCSLGVPDGSADLVWTAQNYHDIHIFQGAAGDDALNKAIFAALKPGGLYVVVDHAAAAGADDDTVKKLHRIDEALVKKQVLAAGFVADGESSALRNPADPKTANVFDPSIRGKTDQFVLRFKKPK